MGVVYEAEDQRLHRRVAIKSIHPDRDDPDHRRRLWREARAAARVNHPHICQIHEVVEEGDEIHIVMELVEGEPLSTRILEQEMSLPDALKLTIQIADALTVLHEAGIVHRDLKPANTLCTAHGIKLLDFGLARPLQPKAEEDVEITQEGKVIGSPRYMAPEIWAGKPGTPQGDLFALGAILFEMLTGQPAFRGRSFGEVCWSILHDEPPPLTGGAQILAVDRVIQRALAKAPEDRYASASSMASDLRDALGGAGGAGSAGSANDDAIATVGAATRIMVAPFRLLRPDEEIEFLSFSLPDALTTSLATADSLMVSSSAKAAQFAQEELDFEKLDLAGIDLVLTGTLLRARDEVRVTSQLVEVPSGTIRCSDVSQMKLDDIFALQDQLAREILGSLEITASTERVALQDDIPRSGIAYEHYLRANKMANNHRMFDQAVKLYRSCLELDPEYAPAWARLGRLYRVMAKYEHGDDPEEYYHLAGDAFDRALRINPDLSIAHNLYTYFEVEERAGARESMARLLQRARHKVDDPHLFAALVVTCRFCGLLRPSIAAHERARRLDPDIPTSVHYTYWFLGDYERAIRHDDEDMQFVRDFALTAMGREDEALRNYRELERSGLPGVLGALKTCSRAALEGARDECRESGKIVLDSAFHDPEGLYFILRALARVDETELAMSALRRIVAGGFVCVDTYRSDPALDSLRDDPEFDSILADADEANRQAVETYRREDGESLLGPLD
jgi:TolB-like protein